MKNRKGNRKAFLLVIVAALTLEVTALVQFLFSQEGMRKEASLRAESYLEATRNEIMDIVDQTEAAVRNSVWIAQWCLNVPDSLGRVCQRIVEDNPVVAGSTVALVPGYLPKKPLFSPYVCWDDEGNIQRLSLATEEYDYPSQEWFVEPLKIDSGYWSEPYVDEGGGNILMTTYSLPIHDAHGRQAAVLTADISLEWLEELVGRIKVYPHAYCLVNSRKGNAIIGPPEVDETGYQKKYTYDTVVERTGWSISIVVPTSDIFGELRRIGTLVMVLQVLGLLMLIFIIQSFIRGQNQFQALNEKRERMESELHIASGIQMSMVPKMFPPFPDRNDLDMAADLIPAKEVGGDLYDYFVRDGKLFFCIGDVSGKGIPASLVMAVTRTTFRNLSAQEDSPGVIVRSMNDNLSSMNQSNMFVTFFCGVLDLKNGHLLYCNAGHNPPLLLTDAKRMLPVEPNLPLGIMGGMEFKEQEIEFRYDDALFLYTDGITEAENEDHELFGEQRMMDALHGRKGAYAHLQRMEEKVHEFVGDAQQSDDLTMLFIHYLGKEPENHRLNLIMHNNINQITRLEGWLEAISEKLDISPALVPSLNLALEEAVTNVIEYAYPKETYGSVELEASREGNTLTFVLTDSGKAFDPTAKPPVDITASVEDRPIGGLGIHMVRSIMDRVIYDRTDGMNILKMTKNI